MAQVLSSILFAVCLMGSLQARFLNRRDDPPTNDLGNNHCDPLEKLMEQLVKSKGIQVFLDLSKAMNNLTNGSPRPPPETTDDFFKMVKISTGLDPRDHSVRHAIACTLYGVKSLDDLAALIGASPDVVEMYYTSAMALLKEEVGGVDSISTIINVFMEYNTWMVTTGFPTMPLKGDLSFSELRDQMQTWQDAIMNLKVDRDTMAELLNSGINPLKFAPAFTAAVVTGDNPTSVVKDMLCINDDVYSIIQKIITPDNIKAINDLAGTTLKIIKELDRMGLFNLKRE